MTEPKTRFSLNATQLKTIAVILMVFDHIHQMFTPVGAPIWLTWLGRPVMVLFLFAAAESFHYTHDRKRYLTRLFLGSLFMQVFSPVLQTVILPNENIALMNNAFSTFLVAGLYMLFWDMLREGIREKRTGKAIGAIFLFFVPALTSVPAYLLLSGSLVIATPWLCQVSLTAAGLLPNLLLVEGGPLIILLGLLFYVLRKWRAAQIAVLAAYSLMLFVSSADPSNQWLMVFAAIPILLYNGKKGRGMKNFFYVFYPAHIYVLYIIATLWP